jgi:transposase
MQFKFWVGIDIGKSFHFAHVMDVEGNCMLERQVDNRESTLDALLDEVLAHGTCALVVDQSGSMSSILLALAARRGVPVAYLPGLVMRRASGMYPGDAKTDKRDAFVIADTARLHARRLNWLRADDQIVVELEMLCGHDEDLRHDMTRHEHRIRDMLVGIAPEIERVVGSRLDRPAIAKLLERYPTPAAMRRAGRSRLFTTLAATSKRMATVMAEELWAAVQAQSVSVPSESVAGEVISSMASDLHRLIGKRRALEKRIEELFVTHPDAPIILSLPGVGTRIGARMLTEIGDVSRFPTANHFASYGGLAPRTSQSGTSINYESRSAMGNKRLKNAHFISAFCSLRDPDSRAYYARKRAQGKKHNSAVLCLARRRSNVLYAMLRNRTVYTPQTT